MRIPTLAIHLDKNVNTNGFKVNTQTHLLPVLATSVKAELGKVVAENGPDGSGEATDEKKSSKETATQNIKHHPLLCR